MMSFPVLDGIEALTICADNDVPQFRAADACEANWRRAGRDVVVREPPRHLKDYGAVAQGGRNG
jgi:hypothetical protein